MTVLQVVPTLDTGGAERTTLDIAAALVEAGDRAIVVSAGGRMVDELVALGGEHVTMPVARKGLPALRANAARLADLAEREGVDVIHARSRAPAWSALWAASWTFRPLVTTYHGIYNERTRLKNLYNSVMARGRLVIANSHYTARLVAERHPFAAGRIVTVHRGIDVSRYAGGAARAAALREAWRVAPDTPVILHHARLTGWKGQRVLIDALARLAQRRAADPWVAVLAGDAQGRDDYRAELAARAAAAGVADRLRIVGHVADVAGALAAASVAVQPSVEPEAFGRAAVEAQAAGVPVIASDHGAVGETVLAPPEAPAARRTGWRVAPADPDALADALCEALALGVEARAAMGERGRAHAATHFSLASMKRKTLSIYHSVLDDEDFALC